MFVIITQFILAQSIYSQNIGSDTTLTKTDSTVAKEFRRKVDINVIPSEASDASILIIKKTKIEIGENYKSRFDIIPDTIGIWKAPLSINLFTGGYDIIANKKGFKRSNRKY